MIVMKYVSIMNMNCLLYTSYYSPFGQIDQTYARRWGHYTYRNLPKIYDAHIITAEYLIDNNKLHQQNAVCLQNQQRCS